MLRICVPLALLAGFEFTEVHRVIAWLCWVPNLVVALLLLRCPPVRPSPTAPSRH